LLDLFSGIGCFNEGLRKSGLDFQKVYFSDTDKYANYIYMKRFPDAISLGNVRNIDINEQVDIMTAGFPCPKFSRMGNEEGFEKDNLFYSTIDIAKKTNPYIIIYEM
jgi:DNA (cytosine-5)-methyltransferase 1